MSSRNKRRNRRNTPNQGNQRSGGRENVAVERSDRPLRRSSTETKSSLKTTELMAYAAAVLAVVMTSLAVDGDADGGNDPFGAEHAIRFITYLTIGYMIARGLAKAGSHEYDEGRRTDLDDGDAVSGREILDDRDETGDVEARDDDRDGEAEVTVTDRAASHDDETAGSSTPTGDRDAAEVTDRPAATEPNRAS